MRNTGLTNANLIFIRIYIILKESNLFGVMHMKSKKYGMQCVIKGLCVSLLMFSLCGCANEIPEMTTEEEQAISEYAAMMLLRYDANNRSRLVDLSKVEEKEQSEQTVPDIKEPEDNTMRPVEDTPVIDSTQNGGIQNVGSMESFFSLPGGVSVVYKGQQICTSYSDAQNDYLVIEASEGNRLLVMSFEIHNQSPETQKIDFLRTEADYKVTVNGTVSQTPWMTMLMNDMSTYVGDVPTGGSQEVVLIVEVDEATSTEIKSLILNVQNESNVCTINCL